MLLWLVDLYGTEKVHHTLVIIINITFIIRHQHYRRRRRYHQRHRRHHHHRYHHHVLHNPHQLNVHWVWSRGREDPYEYDKYLMPKNNETINWLIGEWINWPPVSLVCVGCSRRMIIFLQMDLSVTECRFTQCLESLNNRNKTGAFVIWNNRQQCDESVKCVELLPWQLLVSAVMPQLLPQRNSME